MIFPAAAVNSLSEGVNSLKDSLTSPKEGEVTLQHAQEHGEKFEKLNLSFNEMRDGWLAILLYVFGCKAKESQKIGKTVLSKEYWKLLPERLRPGSEDTYQKIFDLRAQLLDDKKTLDEIKGEFHELEEDLQAIGFDLQCILKGSGNSELLTFASASWLEVSEPASYPRVPALKNWGDLTSGSEDELLISAVSSLAKKKEGKIPGIDLPGDFAITFPSPAKKIERFCNAHGWECRYDKDTLLRNQGLVIFSEGEDGSIDSSNLDDRQRVALASVYAAVASLSLQPSSLVDEKSTEVAITYVCSLVARETLGEKSVELMNVALKNGDGGKSALRSRFYSLTRTGSSAMKMFIIAIEKLLEKFARELDKDKIEGELLNQVTNRSFTSIDGMMENSYRTAKIDAVKYDESVDKRGKPVKTAVKYKKLHKVVPDLSTGSFPLKPEEVSKINSIKEKFNDRKSVIEKRVKEVSDSTILTQPLICREVVTEAYTKLQNFKTIMRDRVVKIRSRATELNQGNKPSPGHWATAKTEILRDAPTIEDSVWSELSWS